ncbi:UvrD-helicase domain-containing protein [uncultured Chitinophaga sp.]|jgi:Superfamily I DNA and RNA helicases|uniref:UvrD-helicase domain-containing protein n=1 Tax=uncultured Chitinophaga sp. TaxID=339340 RepID=UPI0026316025|nr:UvrD-helicase domain-containing protein [uncultured Chitinophaga sp.]
MPFDMQPVTDAEIQYAENILFGRIGVFDRERTAFIKELQTCDLQAVPGSGKTTVLLAKLLILEKRLPFPDHRAVLVISHTNAAIDEIKERIGQYCPKLFSPPHFIGTIQAFVDKFLAIPYYVHVYKRKPARIDDEIFRERAAKFPFSILQGFNRPIQNNAIRYLRANGEGLSFRLSPGTTLDVLTRDYKGNVIVPRKPGNGVDWTPQEKQDIYNWIVAFRNRLLSDGYLSFDDAYLMAEKYLTRFPGIIPILQQRFALVFVDEMQDMNPHQYHLLETLFGAAAHCRFQRIGDNNQSIFDDGGASVWINRPLILTITGSHRLSPAIAAVVERLALVPIAVQGHGVNLDGSPINIKPRILRYQDTTADQVLTAFAGYIEQLEQSGHIPDGAPDGYHAVCWVAQPDPPKMRLPNYYPAYNKAGTTPAVSHANLEDYLTVFPDGRSMRTVNKNVLNGLLKVLRMEGVHDRAGRYYTKSSLLDYIKITQSTQYDTMRRTLFTICKSVMAGDTPGALAALRAYIPQLLQLFHKQVATSATFVNGTPPAASPASPLPVPAINIFTANNINIQVGTVHSVKGQTHTATLYLESCYQRTVQGSGNHESERLSSYLLGQPRPAQIHPYTQQSLRMAYVGFSRPTHLLCFAVHRDRFTARLAGLDPNVWDIVDV